MTTPAYRSVIAFGNQSIVVLRVHLQHRGLLGVDSCLGPWERRQQGNCHSAECGVMHDVCSQCGTGGLGYVGVGCSQGIDRARVAGKNANSSNWGVVASQAHIKSLIALWSGSGRMMGQRK